MTDRTRHHPGDDDRVASLFDDLLGDDEVDDLAPEEAALARFADRAARQRVPWPIVADQFSVVKATPRKGGRVIWTFEHAISGGHLHLDERGLAYRFVAPTSERGAGRFYECEVRRAIFTARLHHVLRPAVGDGVTVLHRPEQVILQRGHLALVHSA